MPPFVAAVLVGLGTMIIGTEAVAAAEGVKVSDACPTFWEKDSPACPSPDSLTWIDCPVTWPKDGETTLFFGTLHPMGWYNDTLPDWDRKTFETERSGFYLDCSYGPKHLKSHQRAHLTMVVPAPVIQYGWHVGPQGRTFGLRVPGDKALASPEILFHAPISEGTSLEGVGLDWTDEQLEAFAAREGYKRVSWWGEPNVGLYRPGVAIEVVFDPQTIKSREVILRAGWQDEDIAALRRKAVLQFGFQWIGGDSGTEKRWISADGRIAVEFRSGHRPAESASLRLIRIKD